MPIGHSLTPHHIEDLLTHTSGLPAGGPRGSSEPQTLTELVTQGAKSELLFEPGTQWNYRNIGIDILGRIVEVVSHQPFAEFLRSRIFEPLGTSITRSFFVPPHKQSRLATLYTYDHGKLTSAEAEWGAQHSAHIPVPAGGVVSTASDIVQPLGLRTADLAAGKPGQARCHGRPICLSMEN